MLNGNMVGLRAIEKDDLPQLLYWRNKPDFRRFFREYRELGNDQQIVWYHEKVIKDRNTMMFSIIELENQILLGACGLCYINWVNRNADFSIYIGYNDLYIDSKYAPDAARVMITYGFEELGLHRLWAEIYDFDKYKEVFLTDLGFKLEGHQRDTYWHNGRWHDSLLFGLLNTDLKFFD